jgi:hypothetical protein
VTAVDGLEFDHDVTSRKSLRRAGASEDNAAERERKREEQQRQEWEQRSEEMVQLHVDLPRQKVPHSL